MTTLRLVTPPAVEPLTLEEVKQHLRVDIDDDDSLIEIYMKAARQSIEGPYGWLGRALVTQTWDLVLDAFPIDGDIKIPLPPLQSIDSVSYDDPDGDEQVMSPTEYWVDSISEPGWVVLIQSAAWPTTLDAVNSVRVRFTAGYAADTSSPPDLRVNVPGNIKAGMLLLIGGMYAQRENIVVGTTVSALPGGVDNLLRPHRIELGMA